MFAAPIPIAAGLPFASFAVAAAAPPPTVADDIREAIGYALQGATAITSVVGTRINMGRRPQLDPLPAMTYMIQSNIPGRTLAGEDGTSIARVRFWSTAKRLRDSVALAKALRVLFNASHGDLHGVFVRWCWKIDETDLDEYAGDGSDDVLFVIQSDYQFDHIIGFPA